MKYIYFILLNFFAIVAVSQTITVIDEFSSQPVANIEIVNPKTSEVYFTDNKGKFFIDDFDFSKSDTLFFKHFKYKIYLTTYSELARHNFLVKLRESVLNINEVVIAANRWETEKKEVPSKITTVTSAEISLYNPQTTADLLKISDEVFIQKSQLGGGSPMIRGFAANRVILVVDGVRMNNAIFRGGNLQNVISLDANSVSNSEIIFGPGSVLYGSDAIGGVMDFHTLEPKLSTDSKVLFYANALARYSSANNEKTGHIDFGISTSKLGFLSSFTYSDFDDLKMGSIGHSEYTRPEYVENINGKDSILKNNDNNIQKFSGYSQLNFMQKIRFSPSKKINIVYGFHYSQLSDVPRYDRLVMYRKGKLKYGEWYYGPQKWMMNFLIIKLNSPNLLFDQAKLTIAHQNYEESRHDRKFGKTKIRERTEQVSAISANLDFDKQLNDKNTLFYGLEFVGNSVGSTGRTRNIKNGDLKPYASRYPDGSKYYSYASYLNYKNNICDKFTLIAGLRYNQIILTSKFDTTFYKFPFEEINIHTGALNGSIGFAYRPNTNWQLNMNIASGFRSPNVDDIGKVFDSEPYKVIVPNENLHSEYVYNIDLGIIKNFADIIKIDLTGFYSILNNAMVRRDFKFNGQDSIVYDGVMSKVQAIVNTDQAIVYGFQAGLYADITSFLSCKTNITYTKGEDKDGLPLRHVAPLFGSTHILFEFKGLKADLYADYNGEISNKNLAISEQSKSYMYATDANGKPYSPSWLTFNSKFTYQFNKYLQFNFGVENIFDRRYRPYASGIVAPGRNFILGIRASLN